MIGEIIAAVSKIAEAAETVEVTEFTKTKEYSEIGKKVLEPNIEIAKWKSLESVIQTNIEKGIERIPTRKQDLEGKNHPDTGVPYVVKVVENSKGELVEVVVPEFDSIFDLHLPEELYEATDNKQFSECNRQLKEAVQNDPELAAKFTEEQLEQIMNGDTPDGYTWHHDAEKGKMQLVDSKIHAQTGHTGGRAIWGGGSGNR
ncbi:HNH endonuclease [Neobacillus piezotolerans]|uniref:HNH endonuclease n=1 Tax=Neobacillus piezotolerans TaxID=2259171 RepID=A0A3D8GW38_9BACI|nr:HNH endonuclease [Neobacillus piezotolerans]RDU38674.1 HNH endonuclease [Neobacillus piezotolerans]